MKTIETTMPNDSKEQEQSESKSPKLNPEAELIDDVFYVYKKKYGLWDSTDKDGKCLVTSLTKESCIRATRFYLKGLQEGWPDDTIKHEGTVGGKL